MANDQFERPLDVTWDDLRDVGKIKKRRTMMYAIVACLVAAIVLLGALWAPAKPASGLASAPVPLVLAPTIAEKKAKPRHLVEPKPLSLCERLKNWQNGSVIFRLGRVTAASCGFASGAL